jgi:hypothetical protein
MAMTAESQKKNGIAIVKCIFFCFLYQVALPMNLQGSILSNTEEFSFFWVA